MSLHPSSLVRGRRVARLAALVAAAAALAVPSAGAASAAPAPAITPSFFGAHHLALNADGPEGYPQAPVGSIRLWDNGVSWRQIETAPGVFDWTLVDAEMAKARAHGASVLLVLGQTPTFHSTRPTVASTYGKGASAMPTKDSWTRYVRAVAVRNRTVWGHIASFQVWNEANVVGYWSGTPQQMATLTAWTDAALRAADPSARLVAPALVARLSGQQRWIDAYFSQNVAGRNVSSYVDAVSLQLYPAAGGTPEASMALLTAARRILARHHVSKPIWNTEVNYGLVGGPGDARAVAPLSSDRQVANVLRTFVLNAGNRVSRVYWYSWDLQRIANTRLVQPDLTTPTPAGQAFTTVRNWLVGSRPAGCARARTGTWTCTFTTGSQTRRVVWNPARTTAVTLPGRTTTAASWQASPLTRLPGGKVRVGPVPVLLTTPR